MITEKELPTSVLDLVKPEWKNKFAFVKTSGTFQVQLSAMIKLEGRDAAKARLEGVKKNGKVYRHDKAALEAVECGDTAITMINNYYCHASDTEVGVYNLSSRLSY